MSKPVVAVVGFNGLLGKPIVNALTSELFKNKFSLPVRVITRDISKAPTEFTSSPDVKFYQGNDLDSYVIALKGVDVLLDIRALLALTDFTVIDAAKKAGVKLYSPSDYGTDYYDTGKFSVAFKYKSDTAEYAKKLGLQVVQIHTGFFLDLVFKHVPKIVFIDPANKVTDYPADGSTVITLTSLKNIGQAVAGILSHPFSEIPGQVYISGNIISLSEISKIYESVTGTTLEHKPKTTEELVKVADDHFTNGTVGAGFLDILRAISVSTKGNDFSKKSNNDFANPGLFKWETVSELAPTII